MIDRQSEAALVDAYRRERLSFLQYVRQALPYAGRDDQAILDRVLAMARTEQETLDGLGDYLDRQRVLVPPPGAFPISFTNYNFITVRKLLPHLAADQANAITSLERTATQLPPGEGRSWLDRVRESKQRHLNELEKLSL